MGTKKKGNGNYETLCSRISMLGVTLLYENWEGITTVKTVFRGE